MEIKTLNIPVIDDIRGNLAFIQNVIFPFEFKRTYNLFDLSSNAYPVGHSHTNQHEILNVFCGSLEVTLYDESEKEAILHNKPNVRLNIKTGIWRELENFSSGAVCLVLASEVFKEDDYIRDYDDFLKSVI